MVGDPSSDGVTIKVPYGVDVLHRPALVVAVISVDAYPFLAFADLTCHLEVTGVGVFWLRCVPPDNKETVLGSSDQEASPSTGKKYWGSFSGMFAHGSASLQLFPVVWMFRRSLGVIATTMSSQ